MEIGNLKNWLDAETTAFELSATIGRLWYTKTVDLLLFRKRLVDQSPTKIITYHDYGKNIMGTPVDICLTLELAREIQKMDIYRARIDLGTLALQWNKCKDNYVDIAAFIKDKLGAFIGKEENMITPRDVILYGFGRIGRIAAREIIRQSGKGEQLRLKAIVTRRNSDDEIRKRVSLFQRDSVHGVFESVIDINTKEKYIIINGQKVYMIAANNPSEIDYTAYGIKDALVIDNTGVWRDEAGLSQHLVAKGVSKVLLTAPGKGNIPNIVYGVNHQDFDINKVNIFSAASCTTNAIVPPLFVLENEFEIEKGHMETIHSYTNDQNLLDNIHKKARRGRSAPLNMVLTETGASKAAAKVIPSLVGKLTASAVRIPTPDASLAILMLTVKKETSTEEVNKILENAALRSDLVNQIEYSYSTELVSSDIVGKSCPAVIDSNATLCSSDGKNIVVYVWYDNEYGYTRQAIRLAKHIANVALKEYY